MMKGNLYAIAVVLFTVLTTACNNDDIEITEVAASFDLKLNVSTQQAYSQLGVAEDIQSSLSPSTTYYNCVYSYVYDAAGNLVANDSVYSKTLGVASMSYSLKKGKYTVVSVEMIVDKEYDYISDYWTIIDKERLGTLAIKNYLNERNITSRGVLGYSVRQLDFNGSATENISLDAIGSMVDIEAMNFEDSPYQMIRLATKNRPLARYLSPEYKGDDRYIYDRYNQSNTWNSRGYLLLNRTGSNAGKSMSVYIMEEGSVHYFIATVENPSDVKVKGQYPSADSYFDSRDGQTLYGGIVYTGGPDDNDCKAFLGSLKAYNEWKSQISF